MANLLSMKRDPGRAVNFVDSRKMKAGIWFSKVQEFQKPFLNVWHENLPGNHKAVRGYCDNMLDGGQKFWQIFPLTQHWENGIYLTKQIVFSNIWTEGGGSFVLQELSQFAAFQSQRSWNMSYCLTKSGKKFNCSGKISEKIIKPKKDNYYIFPFW